MTLLVSWVGIDTHGVASSYIVADSRISWNGKNKYDNGKKIFAFNNSPDILGFCGDVLFPTMVLAQISDLADRKMLFPSEATAGQKFGLILEKIMSQFEKYPKLIDNITNPSFSIIYSTRSGLEDNKFFSWVIYWTKTKGWSSQPLGMPEESDILIVLGSGKNEFLENYKRYLGGPNKNTSRSVYHCFCDTLNNFKGNSCGGAPQLVGIYRKPFSKSIVFGTIYENKKFLMGSEVSNIGNLEEIEWRNSNFECCDPISQEKFQFAQYQPDIMKR